MKSRVNFAKMGYLAMERYSAEHSCVVLEPARNRVKDAKAERARPGRDSWSKPMQMVTWYACGVKLTAFVRERDVTIHLDNPATEKPHGIESVVANIADLPIAVARAVKEVQAALGYKDTTSDKNRARKWRKRDAEWEVWKEKNKEFLDSACTKESAEAKS